MAAGDSPRRIFEKLALVVAIGFTVLLGLMVPGLGLLAGVAIGMIVYRRDRAKRTGFIALGGAVTVVAIFAVGITRWTSGEPHARISNPVAVRAPTN